MGDGSCFIPSAAGDDILQRRGQRLLLRLQRPWRRHLLRRYGRRHDGSEPSHTGDGICSNAAGKSSKPSHAGDGICSDATGDGSCFFPGATGNSICS